MAIIIKKPWKRAFKIIYQLKRQVSLKFLNQKHFFIQMKIKKMKTLIWFGKTKLLVVKKEQNTFKIRKANIQTQKIILTNSIINKFTTKLLRKNSIKAMVFLKQ